MSENITVDYLTRVEGEGAFEIKIDLPGKIDSIRLKIFEPPRFFEGFMVGRKFDEATDIASRICGICSVSHQIASIGAVENAMGIEISEQTRKVRRLINIGEHIMNLTVHVYMLAAPDYLGYESIFAFKKEHLGLLERAFRLKKAGDFIIEVIGGRSTHPMSIVPAGMSKALTKEELDLIKKELKEVIEDAVQTARWVSALELPDFNRECEFISLVADKVYPLNEGSICSNNGLKFSPETYKENIEENRIITNHSHALRYKVKGRSSFSVGPLARVNLNFNKLSSLAKKLSGELGFKFPNFNPFYSIRARALEILHLVEEGIKLADEIEPGKFESSYEIRAGHGFACVCAPRGILYYEYKINKDGIVEYVDIVTPTACFAGNLEQDYWQYVPELLDLNKDELKFKCQMLARAYDPCFSCSVH